MSELSWKPELKGDTYCAPACGSGCTKEQFFDASRRGLELSKRLGEGWSFRVSENLGWHYHAVSSCRRLKVSASRDGSSFTAFLGTDDGGCSGKWAEHGETPEKAILNVIAAGRAVFDEVADLLDGL